MTLARVSLVVLVLQVCLFSYSSVNASEVDNAPVLVAPPPPTLAPAPEPTPSYINPNYADIEYWGAWAIQNGYNIDNYIYSEGNSTGIDGVIGNEFVCIRDDTNQVIIGRPDVCGTYYNGLGYSYADITTDPTQLVSAPDIIDAVTGNLVDQNLQNWGGCNYTGQNLGGTNPGGPQPNCGQDIINWSYGGYWVYRRHAIEQALKQAGVQVDGYQWEFRIKNLNGDRADQSGTDALDIIMTIWDNSNNQVHQKSWRYDTKFDWTTFSGTELFGSPLIGENLRDWQIQMYGRDSGYWAGFYGPEMNIPEIRMIYSTNPCAIDPILHPDCEGYVDAYANYLYDQQCIANPLYDSACPGYQQAYFDQQCNANPLYDMGCPGYQQAYFDQQCNANPLYDVGCPGYQQAYFDQQCSIDPFYDTTCPGYAQAYFDQQCSLDVFYDTTCPGYETAYYETYIKPDLDKQIEDAAGTNDTTDTSTDIASVTDPVKNLTEVSVTGDATVDEVLRSSVDTTTNSIIVAPTVPEVKIEIVETKVEEKKEEQVDEIASIEGELDVERTDESSSDVDEQMGEGGGEESGDTGGEENESDSKSDSEGSSESRKSDSKNDKKSKREKLKEAITKKAMMLAENMSNAATLEAQQAVQAQVLALINYVPDFGQYGGNIAGGYYPDAASYPDTKLPENNRGLRNGLAQQLLHEQMVEMQYENNNR